MKVAKKLKIFFSEVFIVENQLVKIARFVEPEVQLTVST
jgi:hypothetical protein